MEAPKLRDTAFVSHSHRPLHYIHVPTVLSLFVSGGAPFGEVEDNLTTDD
jgi:hypothetical protein